MILVIDNYDSFTYNLVQYIGSFGCDVKVYRNDKITIREIQDLSPKAIIISPGPGVPRNAGVALEIIKELGKDIPILGVCLGHQCIGEVYGGKVVKSENLMHGKTSLIYHDGKSLFEKIPKPFKATRYHSLLVEKETLPDCLEITARTEQGEIMGIRHKTYPVEGVQFHPESILTEYGKELLNNFLLLHQAV